MHPRERLLGTLEERHILRDLAVRNALASVDLESFLPPELRPLAYANAPIPFDVASCGVLLPSPPVLAALLQLLELTPALCVGIVGAAGGYAAALVAHAVPNGRVSVAEADPGLREATREHLRTQGLADRVGVADDLEGGPFDRVLVLDPGQRPARDLGPRLSDLGFAVSLARSPDGPEFRKRIRSGGEDLELSVTEMPAGSGADPQAAGLWARILLRDELASHAWQGRTVGHHDAHFREAVEETFAGGPLDPGRHALSPVQWAARGAFHVAYILQSLGDLEDSADLYERSLRLFPTAEGHTFLGWVHSFEGDVDRAIAECRRAIAVDPTFGNPYNDIGAYLIDLQRPDEAVPWLQKALEAERYCCYFYAHTNLGRAYLLTGREQLARRHFEEALKVNPAYEPAKEMLKRVDRGTAYFA